MTAQTNSLADTAMPESAQAEVSLAELFRANVRANLAFFRRSRLLMAFGLVFLLMMVLRTIPPLFTDSGVQRFETLAEVFSELNGFLLVLSGGLGLFVISTHLRNRSLKMVFTKPCSPAVWLLSAFVSAVAVSFLLSCLVLANSVAMSLIWHLPVRAGLLFVAADNLLASVSLIAYLMFLAMLVHPAIAVTCAALFNASMFYSFYVWTLAYGRAGNSGTAMRAMQHIFHFLYLLFPIFYVFSEKTAKIYSSLRVAQGDWKYLLYSLGYVVVLSVFCYLVSLFLLQKKQHI